jgi:hypothetical protein
LTFDFFQPQLLRKAPFRGPDILSHAWL